MRTNPLPRFSPTRRLVSLFNSSSSLIFFSKKRQWLICVYVNLAFFVLLMMFSLLTSTFTLDTKKPVQAQKSVAGATAAPAVVGVATDKNKAAGGRGGRGGGGRGDNRDKGRGAGRGGKETGERKNGKREYDRRSGTGR
jgi:hypothetical protein